MPHYVGSDLGLHYLPMTLYGFPGKNGLRCPMFWMTRVTNYRVEGHSVSVYVSVSHLSTLNRSLLG